MRKRKHGFLLLVIILFVFCSLNLPRPLTPLAHYSTPASGKMSTEFSADKAYEHILHLSEKIGPRPAGSQNETKAAQYLYYMLEQYGWKVREQPFSKIVSNSNPLKPEHKIQVINSQNIIAELPGALPETILLGAHYDSADISAPGAIDNASGVGVLLEIARILGQEKHQKSYQIVFFGAEENGLVGSQYFTAQSDLSAVQWMLNLDMVGTPLEIDIAGKTSAPPELVDKVVTIARQEQIPFHISRDFVVMTREGSQGGASDFSPFLDQGIPALGLGIAGRAEGYYHRPEDRIEQVTLQSLDTVGKFIPKLIDSVEVTGSGQKTWDSYYLPFQLGSFVLIIPTLGLRILFILIIFFTLFSISRSFRDNEPFIQGDLKEYVLIGVGIPVVAFLVSSLSGTGEWLWQFIKERVYLWQAYPGVFLTLRVIMVLCALLIFLRLLRSFPQPKGGKLYWLVGVLILTLLTIILGLYRIDLAFPFLFWLFCFNLFLYYPSIVLLFTGPYFIYKTHWELLNSQQWSGFYETIHHYPIVFIVLYGLLFIPVLLGALYILEKGKRPWDQMLKRLFIPALVLGVGIVLGTGLIPNYNKTNPQPISVQKVWTESEEVVLRISSTDTLSKNLITELDSKETKVGEDKKTLELPIPSEKPPLQANVSVTDTGGRLLNFKMAMKYGRDPYLVRIKLESKRPFKIREMDDFIPIAKLPKKIALEGKEHNGSYTLLLERTPPHQGVTQWKIAAEGIVKCSIEVVFADQSPRYSIKLPHISSEYKEVYQDVFEF
ncbi:MAG TPA: Zn-dependent exopeptidase M28 [Desulfitobacterium dehalogenans]|uniref:Zn-dependent exopeptidase M28 n=1 Tax=Desulfitobacterium dehalogenans TaxID=36854 RepID=A0A7C7D865_9FIRM|nr:Zn-dependent exopeptidase M28 [Desulfitobacterium dehalogenans]